MYRFHRLFIRKLKWEDRHLLVKWLSTPEVLKFYEGRDRMFDLEKVESTFYLQKGHETGCIVEYDGVPIGYVQFYKLDSNCKEDYGLIHSNEILYGMDQFIGEVDYWNKGIGTQLVTAMIDFLTTFEKAERILMDPQITNSRAIHCYEKCGFQKVKRLLKRELHEGEYRDCWLMEYTH